MERRSHLRDGHYFGPTFLALLSYRKREIVLKRDCFLFRAVFLAHSVADVTRPGVQHYLDILLNLERELPGCVYRSVVLCPDDLSPAYHLNPVLEAEPGWVVAFEHISYPFLELFPALVGSQALRELPSEPRGQLLCYPFDV